MYDQMVGAIVYVSILCSNIGSFRYYCLYFAQRGEYVIGSKSMGGNYSGHY